MTFKIRSAAALVVFAAALSARAEDQPFDDVKFVKTAAIDGMTEVKLGKLAAAQAKNDDVKKFGERMVKDHTKAGDDLKAAAKAAGIPFPDALDEKHQKEVETFKSYTGADFDAAYVKDMVDDHTKAVALFTRASKEAKDQGIKDFATATLPVLKEHLELAKKLSNK
jgi:putative membrane protein